MGGKAAAEERDKKNSRIHDPGGASSRLGVEPHNGIEGKELKQQMAGTVTCRQSARMNMIILVFICITSRTETIIALLLTVYQPAMSCSI